MRDDDRLLPPRYRDARRIGQGGMGDIYRATDTVLGREVAVKLLAERYARDTAIRERFTREALAAARLSGEPNTVTIYDVGEAGGRPFIVMELLGGGSLEDVLRANGRVAPAQGLRWLEQAARALDAAHASGIVHRDVKPANLLLDDAQHLHVADFGVASAAGLDSLTAAGTILGTAGYLSPEQARGERATDASDRYGLAVVAWELLTGERPFANPSVAAEAAAHANAPVPSLSAAAPGLPATLDAVFERALAKDPRARHPSSVDFVADLRHAFERSSEPTRLLPPPGAPHAPRRRRLLPLALAAAAALGGIVAGVLVGRGGDGRPTARPATIVRTQTTRGKVRTVTVVTTTPAPVASTAAPATTAGGAVATAAPAPGGGSVAGGIRLTDRATALIRSGDYAGALPVAEQALAALQGTGERYEAYAYYNVGKSLIGLGRCAEGLPYLARSEQIQGHRPEIDRDRAACAQATTATR